MDKELLKQEALKWRAWFYKGQRGWSALHHASVYGTILCSVAAGAILQLRPDTGIACASILTSLAATLSSLAAAGGFQRKWRSNRLSRSKADGLLIDLEAGQPDLPALAAQLKAILSDHDREIVREEAKDLVAGAAGNPA